MRHTLFNIVLSFINLALLMWLTPLLWVVGHKENLESAQDSLAIAMQLGRLDLVSVVLSGLAVILVFGGIFSYLHFRDVAEKEARNTADHVAREVANEYQKKGGQEDSQSDTADLIDPRNVDVSQALAEKGD